jgi:hypothetical protein
MTNCSGHADAQRDRYWARPPAASQYGCLAVHRILPRPASGATTVGPARSDEHARGVGAGCGSRPHQLAHSRLFRCTLGAAREDGRAVTRECHSMRSDSREYLGIGGYVLTFVLHILYDSFLILLYTLSGFKTLRLWHMLLGPSLASVVSGCSTVHVSLVRARSCPVRRRSRGITLSHCPCWRRRLSES